LVEAKDSKDFKPLLTRPFFIQHSSTQGTKFFVINVPCTVSVFGVEMSIFFSAGSNLVSVSISVLVFVFVSVYGKHFKEFTL
jgi:hypothetical protein